MKPTSLSPEFYTNLYNEIINHGFEPETEDDCHCNMEVEDIDGFFVNLEATFEVNVIDDSFDHAFGIEYGCHFECGNLIDIEAVVISDKDGNELNGLFDYDAFFEQFKCYEVELPRGVEIKSGETVLACYGGYRWELAEFLYRDTLKGSYICKPSCCKFDSSYNEVLPNTEENRKRLNVA